MWLQQRRTPHRHAGPCGKVWTTAPPLAAAVGRAPQAKQSNTRADILEVGTNKDRNTTLRLRSNQASRRGGLSEDPSLRDSPSRGAPCKVKRQLRAPQHRRPPAHARLASHNGSRPSATAVLNPASFVNAGERAQKVQSVLHPRAYKQHAALCGICAPHEEEEDSAGVGDWFAPVHVRNTERQLT